MQPQGLELEIYYLASALDVILFIFLVRLLLRFRRVELNVIRAKVFLDAKFFEGNLQTGALLPLLLIAQAAAYRFEMPALGAFFVLMITLVITKFTYDWGRLISASVPQEKVSRGEP